MKSGSFIWLIGAVVFAVWVMLAMTPDERLSRACRPVAWVGNITTSLAGVAEPSWEAPTNRFFVSTDYVCRYTAWRLFYSSAWKRQQLRSANKKTTPPKVSGGAKHPKEGK